MSDHEQLADEQEERADRMEQESERVGDDAQKAREELERANSDELIPEAMGENDPAARGDVTDEPEEGQGPDEPETDYPAKR